MMNGSEVVALGFRYPNPTWVSTLTKAIGDLPAGAVRRHMQRFLDGVSALPLGAWEELHTATLDLSAPVVPYVGHIAWGENYRRGSFMADMQAAMVAEGVELDGELPDHIEPILRYLSVTDDPLPDLIDVLPRAVVEMEQSLRRSNPDNPYCHLLAATVECAGSQPVSVGGRR